LSKGIDEEGGKEEWVCREIVKSKVWGFEVRKLVSRIVSSLI